MLPFRYLNQDVISYSRFLDLSITRQFVKAHPSGEIRVLGFSSLIPYEGRITTEPLVGPVQLVV